MDCLSGGKGTPVDCEEIQTFIRLGLTFVQSKVYLALIKAGFATIKTISKTAQLDRSEVYRGISELQRLGLVETDSQFCWNAKPKNSMKPEPKQIG